MSKAKLLSQRYKTLLGREKIDTPLRLAHFFAQIDHESGLVPTRESLYYTTPSRAKAMFYTPFNGKSDSFVQKYLKNTQAMANYVYANRMGNGNEASNDGFRFRGGGYMQHTGRAEYARIAKITGADLINNPNLILEEPNAIIGAIDYWNRNNLSRYADRDNIDAISDLINMGRLTSKYGDANGFKDRLNKLNNYKKIFGV